MYHGKRIIALIPARGGSKGIPGKNIKPFAGKPLIAWTILAAKRSKLIDAVVVSTDDKKIASCSRRFGARVPFMRPAVISTDRAKMMDVIVHAVKSLQQSGEVFDYLVLLQPTSPLRTAEHIDGAIKELFDKKGSIVLGVTKMEHPPQCCNVLPPDGNMKEFYPKEFQKRNRQELEVYYRLNGAVYVAQVDYLLRKMTWFTPKSFAYVMDAGSSVDINTYEDFLYAQMLFKLGGSKR